MHCQLGVRHVPAVAVSASEKEDGKEQKKKSKASPPAKISPSLVK
jgi:hypothetical protein